MEEEYHSTLGDEPIGPELKAHIVNLVSALGGRDLTAPGAPYKLGDDALACLRDLKRWLQAYDDNNEKWDIARCISGTSLVTSDLLEILSMWEEQKSENGNTNTTSDKHYDRIALACLELLVPLTWSLELRSEESTKNHIMNAPHLARARLRYKRAILTHPKHSVLKACLRLAIPSLKIPVFDRTPRDDGILTLVVYFFRNLLSIDRASAVEAGYSLSLENEEERDVSRAFVIAVFNEQNVLNFLLMMGSEMGHAVKGQDAAVLECLFHLLRGVSVPNLYDMEDHEAILAIKAMKQEAQGTSKAPNQAPDLLVKENGPEVAGNLSDLLNLEKGMKKNLNKHAHTRHNRFGTLVTLRYQDERQLSISGGNGLDTTKSSLEKLDFIKKWNRTRPRRYRGYEKWTQPILLTKQSNKILKEFAELFLDAAFNPFFLQISTLIRQDSEKLLESHKHFFLYLAGWFLRCYRARVEFTKDADFVIDYGLVGSVLNADMFKQLAYILNINFDVPKRLEQFGTGTPMIYACTICFKEILLTLKQMDTLGNAKDQQIANVLKEVLFYDGDSLVLLSKIPPLAYPVSFAFMKESVELTHILLRTLEKFASDGNFYVKKVVRKRRKKNTTVNNDENETSDDEDDAATSQQVISERKFDFAVYEQKFFKEKTVTTFISFLSYYHDLTTAEIGHCLAYFYRAFVKQEMRGYFYRLDVMKLLQQIVSHKGLSRGHKHRHSFEKLTILYMRMFKEAVERTPSLFVQLLFPITDMDNYYFSKGEVKEKVRKGTQQYRWEFRDPSLGFEQKLATIVATIMDLDRSPMLEWLIKELTLVQEARSAWVSRSISTFDNEDVEEENVPAYEDAYLAYDTQVDVNGAEKPLVYGTNSLFQVLAPLVGIKIDIARQNQCLLPKEVSSEKLENALKLVKRYMFEPLSFPDGKMAADQLVRKKIKSSMQNPLEGDEDPSGYNSDGGFIVSSDDDEGDASAGFNDERFAALDEEERARRLFLQKEKRRNNGKQRKHSAAKRRRPAEDSGIDGDTVRASKRTSAAVNAYKSNAFVSDSEDDTDEEKESRFFERERQLRERFLSQQAPSSQMSASQGPSYSGVVAQSRLVSMTTPSSPPESISVRSPETGPIADSDDNVPGNADGELSNSEFSRSASVESGNFDVETGPSSETFADRSLGVDIEVVADGQGSSPSVSDGAEEVSAGNQFAMQKFTLNMRSETANVEQEEGVEEAEEAEEAGIRSNVLRPRLRAILESDDE